MFKRKQDVDRHVSSILSRKKDEKERVAQGFQIARLYADIKEYAVSKKYLSAFLHAREKAPPQAHQLMGEINEALDEKDAAIDSYKKALDLGGFGSANRQLILKICDLYCETGNDVQRMKYWLDKCEEFFPNSEAVFRMKSKLTSLTNGAQGGADMEKLLIAETLKRPTDLSLWIQLLNIYTDSKRVQEAYDAAVNTDLTMAFTNSLTWFETIQAIFESYRDEENSMTSDPQFARHYLHVLRNTAYQRLPCRDVRDCEEALERFDQELQHAAFLETSTEDMVAFFNEMKGQLFFLAGLLVLKKAQTGSINWAEANHMSGACFLASHDTGPLDAQSAWFVSAPNTLAKFNTWMYQSSYDRLSQVGHMMQQLSDGEVVDWSREVRLKAMTTQGHQRLLSALYSNKPDVSQHFLASAEELLGTTELKEPLTGRDLIDIDRVASQIHLGELSHLVWLCLQRYTWDMPAQPNYHFGLLDNLNFSVKKMETSDSLCQLDVLTFLLASVRCASTTVNNRPHQESHSMRPALWPPALAKPLCTQEQEEWWATVYKYCTNTVKSDFSRHRRVLTRGIETVRLISPHGVSVPMMAHIARSLEAKLKSLKDGEFGSRCTVSDIAALETRANFYWDKLKKALDQIQRNISPSMPKQRLFKELDDLQVPSPRVIEEYMADATFALAQAAMRAGQLEVAIEGFARHGSPWAKFYTAQMYGLLAQREAGDVVEGERLPKKAEALYCKARECLYEAMDRLAGDKDHELFSRVTLELEDLGERMQSLDLGEERDTTATESFHTPRKSPSDMSAHLNGSATPVAFSGSRHSFVYSTPMPVRPSSSTGLEDQRNAEVSSSSPSLGQRARPSPERLDIQIKSLSNTQSTLFKMVLDRNEDLIRINGKMMEELRENNTQLKTMLERNESLMQDLKTFLAGNTEVMKEVKDSLKENKEFLSENKELMKQVKTDLATMKASPMMPPGPPLPAGPPVFMTPPGLHPQAAGGPRGPGPYFPPMAPPHQTYGYMLNSMAPPPPHMGGPPPPPQAGGPQPPANMMPGRLMGVPGQKPPMMQGAKFKSQQQYEDEDEEEEEDLCSMEEAAMLAEYYDGDYSQYFTPDPPPPVPQMPPPQANQPRMSMPAPGFFASALRGQSLQYSQQTSASQLKPIGPGFFSSPASVGTTAATGGLPGLQGISPTIGLGVLGSGSVSPAPTSLGPSPAPPPLPGLAGTQSPASLGGLSGVQSPVALGAQGLNQPSALASALQANSQGRSKASDFASTTGQISSAAPTLPPPGSSGVSFTTPATTGANTTKFGGFTFTTTPQVKPPGPGEDKAKAEASKPQTSTASDAPKPFAGFSLTPSVNKANEVKFGSMQSPAAPANSQKASNSPQKSQAGPRSPGADERVEEYEPNVDFQPVIALPELVEKKTGEENETPLFQNRCRLFRYAHDLKQWKERGVGELKILKSNEETKYRIVMRRDQILKLCANHAIKADMELKPMANSEKAWLYVAQDFADETVKLEQLAVKFNTVDLASKFHKVFTECVDTLKKAPAKAPSPAKPAESPKSQSPPKGNAASSSEPASSTAGKSLAELFKPKAGSWECSGCLVRNNAETLKCPACNTLKPGVKDTDLPKEEKPSSLGAFTAGPAGTGFRFGSDSSFSSPAASTSGGAGGFKFGGGANPSAGSGGFTFGAPPTSSSASTTVSASTAPTAPGSITRTASTSTSSAAPSSTTTAGKSLAELFKPKAGSWECSGCLVRNNAETLKCPACNTLKPGVKDTDLPKEEKPSSLGAFTAGPAGTGFKFGSDSSFSSPSTGGFKFGSGSTAPASTGGFTFGAPSSSAAATPTSGASESKPATFAFGTAPSSSVSSTSPFGGAGAESSSTPSKGTTEGTAAVGGTPKAAGGGGFSFTAKPGLFQTPVAPAPTSATQGAGDSAGDSKGLLAKLLTSEDLAVDKVLGKPTQQPATTLSAPAATGFNFNLAPKSKTTFAAPTLSSSTSSTTGGFNFSFAKSPATPASNAKAPVVPGSPEVDEQGMYVNKEGEDSHLHFEPVVALPDKIEVKTGEEDETALFESRAKLYRFVSGEWKEKGVGVVKILEHNETKKTRILMRRDQVLKLCCNHHISGDLNLQPMASCEGKAWVWYAMDFSDDPAGKMEQLALRFRNAEIASEFKSKFDQCRESSTPVKGQGTTHPATPSSVKKELFAADSTTKGDEGEDDDVIFVKEEKSPYTTPVKLDDSDDSVIFIKEERATPAQVAEARKWKLPANFYLYLNAPPCAGCLGCTDGEGLPPAKLSSAQGSTPSPFATPSAQMFGGISDVGQKPSTSTSTPPVSNIFGSSGNLPNFSSLTPDQPTSGLGNVFGSGSSAVDFSSLASSGGSSSVFGSQQKEKSGPFHFAGAGQKLFGAGGGGGGEGGEEEGGVVPSEDVHFEPVIPLPDLVQVKTGEEDWHPLFTHRAKLYKFDKPTSQWKERGVGDIKILQHNTQVMFRVLQRREQVLKVACNHLISEDMELKPLATSETAWCWLAQDFTDRTDPSELCIDQYAVKFKNSTIAEDFKSHFEACQQKLREAAVTSTTPAAPVAQAAAKPQIEEEEEEEEYDDDEYEDEEEEERVLFEKRATLSSFENGAWKKLGLGTLRVTYDEDLNGNAVNFFSDEDECLCRHVICQEHKVTLNTKTRSCEWNPLDYSTDEALRKQFSAAFSSQPAAEEFAKTFMEGQRLAVDSELSENLPTEIDVPEIFSAGEPQK